VRKFNLAILSWIKPWQVSVFVKLATRLCVLVLLGACSPIDRVPIEKRNQIIGRAAQIVLVFEAPAESGESKLRGGASCGFALDSRILVMTKHGLAKHREGLALEVRLNGEQARIIDEWHAPLDDVSIVAMRPSFKELYGEDVTRTWTDLPIVPEADIRANEVMYVVPPFQTFPERFDKPFVRVIRATPNPAERWQQVAGATIPIIGTDSWPTSHPNAQGWSGSPVFMVQHRSLHLVGVLAAGFEVANSRGDKIVAGSVFPITHEMIDAWRAMQARLSRMDQIGSPAP
jgi:hypothetical protein